jgi:DNA-binding transcriptional regulator LsrR (DeoR family)
MAEAAPVKLVGIGTVNTDTQLVRSGMITPAEIETIADTGAVGELLGHFFDSDGRIVDTPLTGRTIAVSVARGSPSRVIAIAGGLEKTESIAAVLASGMLSGLIIDEGTARRLAG